MENKNIDIEELYNQMIKKQVESEKLKKVYDEIGERCLQENPNLKGKLTTEYPPECWEASQIWYNSASNVRNTENKIMKLLGNRIYKLSTGKFIVPIWSEGDQHLEIMECAN